MEPPSSNPTLPKLKGDKVDTEAGLVYHQKYVAAAATSVSVALRSIRKMTEDLERTEEDWEDDCLDEKTRVTRELRRLKDIKNNVARELRNEALPTAVFGLKFLAKVFGDLMISKL